MPPPAPSPVGQIVEPSPGFKLPDGYRTVMSILITEPIVAVLRLWIETLKPIGLDGLDPIQISTMWNNSLHTFAPRVLIKATPLTVNAAWNPIAFSDTLDIINVPATCTILFPDGSSIAFYGFLNKFEPGDMKEGEMPLASATVVVTNTDPTDGTEQAPVYTATSP